MGHFFNFTMFTFHDCFIFTVADWSNPPRENEKVSHEFLHMVYCLGSRPLLNILLFQNPIKAGDWNQYDEIFVELLTQFFKTKTCRTHLRKVTMQNNQMDFFEGLKVSASSFSLCMILHSF